MNHHQIDLLKSTPTSDGEETLSLPGHPEFNGPVNWVFLQYILEHVKFVMVDAHCKTLQMDSRAPGYLNGLPVAHFPNVFNAFRGVQGVFGWIGGQSNRGLPCSFCMFLKKSLKKTVVPLLSLFSLSFILHLNFSYGIVPVVH